MNHQQQEEEYVLPRVVGERNSQLVGFAEDPSTGHLYPVLERTDIQPRLLEDGSGHMIPSSDPGLEVGRMMALGGERILVYGFD